MPEMVAVISIGIGVNTLVNVIWLFVIKDLIKRIERMENLFIKSNKQE